VFVHTPAKLGIRQYTTANLPTWYELDGKKYMLPYFELVKNRSGTPGITIPLVNKLYKFDFDEMESDVFEDLVSQQREVKDRIPVMRKQQKFKM